MSNTATMPAPTTDESAKAPKNAHRVLNANDRCDRCGAQAYVEVTKDSALADLLFCGHHFNRHAPALLAAGWTENVNQLDRLRSNTKPDGGSAAG